MVQVSEQHYNSQYQSAERFQLYYHTFNSVVKLKPSCVLEIGIGSGVLTHLLRQNGICVTSADYDERLKPDVIADIRCLPFADNSYDVVLASQVLEHIPYDDVKLAYDEMCRVTKHYCIVSVPYNQHNLTIYANLKINKYLYFGGSLNRLLNKYGRIYLNFGVSRFLKNFIPDAEHEWEIGYKEYPLKRVREMFGARAKILEEYRVPLSPYHYVFILEKEINY